MYREGLFEHHRRDVLALLAAGGTPTAQAVLGPVPEGYCWYLENVAYSVLGNSHTAALDLAVSIDNGTLPTQAAWDHAGLIDTFAAAIRGAQNFANAIKVEAGHYLVAYLSGGTLAAGDAATVSCQISVHQLNPRQLMSPEDLRQVAAAHEHPTQPLAVSAVAERRAV